MAFREVLQRVDDLPRWLRFQDETRSPGAEDRGLAEAAVAASEDDDAAPGIALDQFRDGFRTIHPRHVKIEQDNVEGTVDTQFHARLKDIADQSCFVQAGLSKELREGFAHKVVIVCDKDRVPL
jgi:hypothetical protein